MKHTLSALALSTIIAACAAGPDNGIPAGAGGASSSTTTSTAAVTTTSGGGGMGGDGVGGMTPTYEPLVGAAYPNAGDGRIVLIDVTGTRSVLYNPTSGTFESADDIDELQGGLPLIDVVAVGRLNDAIYYFASDGMATVYDLTQSSFAAPAPAASVLDGLPFPSVGAAFGSGNQLFVFSAGGTSYAAYNTESDTWSPVYSFATDFGGGGAPIASVGAAYQDGAAYYLFDNSGSSFCIYAGNGEFSNDFDIEELGDGNLSFDDVTGD
jgi:hypothetical protein